MGKTAFDAAMIVLQTAFLLNVSFLRPKAILNCWVGGGGLAGFAREGRIHILHIAFPSLTYPQFLCANYRLFKYRKGLQEEQFQRKNIVYVQCVTSYLV